MRRITARERLTIWNSLILLIFTLALPLWAEAEILFQEDFNDGNALGWEEINGNWTVENGEYSSYLNGCNLPGNTFIGSADWRE